MSCEFTAADLSQIITNPATIPNFVRWDWDEAALEADPYTPYNEWQFYIFIGATPYRFDFFIVDDPSHRLTIEDPLGERGRLQVWLNEGDDETRSMLAFLPVAEMYCELWDRSGYCYFSGFTCDPVREQIYGQRADLTLMSLYKLDCKNLYSELEREPIEFELALATPGVALKNAIKQYAPIFDVSEIPLTLGVAQPIKWLGITLSIAIERVTATTDTVCIIEPDTHKIHFVSRNSVIASTGVILTDSNIFDINNSYYKPVDFNVSKDTSTLKTEIEFHYYEKYSRGTVDVGIGDDAVLGHGSPPVTFWTGRKSGGKFYILGATDSYTVSDNQSPNDTTQTIIISPPFTGGIGAVPAVNAEYVWVGDKKKIRYADESAVRTMQAIRGGSDRGKFVLIVHDDQNSYYLNEAIQQAQACLALAVPQPKGFGKTDNFMFQTLPLRSGMSMDAALNETYGFEGNLTFYKITMKSNGSVVRAEDRFDGLARPGLDIEKTFTQTFTTTQAQFRGLLQKAQRTKISDDGEVEDIIDITELLAFKSCYDDDGETNTDLLQIDTTYKSEDIVKENCVTGSRTGFTMSPSAVFFTSGGRAFPFHAVLRTGSRTGYTSSSTRTIYTAG